MDKGSRAGKVFSDYSALAGFDARDEEMDRRDYGMAYRLLLADVVAAEGSGLVVDLGSECGGMTYALKECGVDVISTEYDRAKCKNELKKINPGNVIQCDAFRSPFRRAPAGPIASPDAAVSYMFLGWFVPEELAKGRSLACVFDGLPFSKIYGVELQFEYSSWFAQSERLKRAVEAGRQRGWFNEMELLEPSELRLRLEAALPDWDVEDLENFGARSLEENSYDRLGFRFTKKKKAVSGKKL